MFCVGLGSYYALGVCEYPSARKVFRHSWHQNLSSGQEPEAEVAEDPQVTEAYDVEWKTPPSWKSRTRVAPGKNVVAALALSCYSLNIQSFQCLILNFNSQAVILTLIIQDATNGWCSTDCHKIHMGGRKTPSTQHTVQSHRVFCSQKNIPAGQHRQGFSRDTRIELYLVAYYVEYDDFVTLIRGGLYHARMHVTTPVHGFC